MSDELFEGEKDAFDALENAYATAYPNPDRIGCLDSQTLQDMASGRIIPSSPDDSRLYHVTHCSPCFRELIAFRNKRREERRLRDLANQHRRRVSYAVAAVAVVFIALLAWFWSRWPSPTQPIVAHTQPAPRLPYSPAVVDLRPLSVNRGELTQRTKGPVTLRRGPLALSVYLPIGMDEGPTEVRIMDSQLEKVLFSQQVQAVLRNNTVMVEANVDLSRLTPGRYTLAVRPLDQDWRTYPLQLE